jgi:tetratricopeptide (TPR) repeat protein
VADERRSAKRDLRALLRLPAENREERITRARNRYRGVALVQLLLDESRKRFTRDPREAIHLAELARAVLQHTPQVPGYFDYMALANAYLANATRASGELRRAAEYVRFLIRQEGVTDPEVLARIDDLEGSLRTDQRLFPEAETLLRRAIMLYRLTGASVEQARVLVKLAMAFELQGKTEAAIQTVQVALRSLTPEGALRLYVCARFNLAWYLTSLRQYQDAERLLAEDQKHYRRLREPWTELRLNWLIGRIDAGYGKVEAAERAFLTARDGFIAEGIGYDAAMISVEELAPLYLRAGRSAEVKRLAEEMIPIFAAADVHREALAALIIFVEAVKQEQLTVAMTERIGKYLRDARADPSLRFAKEEPS